MARFALYLVALRPWSFPMTAVSITVGAVYAYSSHHLFEPSIYLVTLLGSIALHAFVNITNDYFDTLYGVDRPGAPTTRYRPHPLISGIMSPSQVIVLSVSLFLLALVSGVFLALAGRWLALPLGLIGALVAYEYTAPPAKLKYRGLGEAAVFSMWGPLMVSGSFYTQTGFLDLSPALVSIPVGILVASVLLIDSIRDYEYDLGSGIKTLTIALGRERALKLFTAMVASAYASPPALYIAGIAGPWALLPLATIPRAVELIEGFQRDVPDTAAPRTAQLAMLYGIALAIGLTIQGIATMSSP